jgi:hypothetical protein
VTVHRFGDSVDVEAPVSAEITAAEAGVARAGVAFSASLRDASLAGTDTARRVVSAARPLLIGVGVLAGALLAVRLLSGSRATPARRPAAPARSVWAELVRTTAISLAAAAGQRLAARWLGPDAARAVRRLSAVLTVLATLACTRVAGAQHKVSLDVEAAFPSSEAHDTGWGAGARLGHAWNLSILALTPELGGSYHAFGGSPGATAFDGVVGARFGINFIVQPSVFAHLGVGHFGYATGAGDVSQTGLMYDVGGALDLTLVPVIDVGAHAAYSRIAGDSSADFAWVDVGAHITFTFGKE